jgi:hypothetical protein
MESAAPAAGLAGATPYGAAIGAAAGVLQSALEEKPSNTSSGAGQFQNGGLTIGAKNVGKGSIHGGTSASQAASQTQPGEGGGSAASALKSNTTLYVIIGAAVALILGGMAFFGLRRRP